MKDLVISCLLLAAALLAPAVRADSPQLYKWTDAAGVVHYSDQPPREPAADLATSDIPTFPAVDQAKLDSEQAALVAQATALQQLVAAQAAAEAQSRAAAQTVADRPEPATFTDDAEPAAPIYIQSAFVPRVYRRNLYAPHRGHDHTASRTRTSPPRPAISLLSRP